LETAEPLDALPPEAKAAHSELLLVARLLKRLEALEDEPAARAEAQPVLLPQVARRLGWQPLPEAQAAEPRKLLEAPLALPPEAQRLWDDSPLQAAPLQVSPLEDAEPARVLQVAPPGAEAPWGRPLLFSA